MASLRRKTVADTSATEPSSPPPPRQSSGHFLTVPEPSSPLPSRPLLDIFAQNPTAASLEEEPELRQSASLTHAESRAQVSTWTTSDVLKWLESKNLDKFVPVCKEYNICGKDIIENRLGALADCGLSMEDKEELLSELYYLLHPEAERPEVASDMRRASNAEEQAKYRVAVAVARCRDSRSASPTLVLLPRRSPSPRPRTLLHRQRSLSESGVDTDWSDLVSPARKYVKRRSIPTSPSGLQRKAPVRGVQAATSVFEVMTHLTPAWTHCVSVTRQAGAFPFVLGPGRAAMPQVTSVSCSDVKLQPGDVILEINGFLLPKGDNPNRSLFLAEQILQASTELQMFVARTPAVKVSAEEEDESRKSQLELEEKWGRLRSLLVKMQEEEEEEEVETVPEPTAIPNQRLQDLEEEVQQLQEALRDHSSKLIHLQATLQETTSRLADVTKQRDTALKQLNQRAGFDPDVTTDTGEKGVTSITETLQLGATGGLGEGEASRRLDRLVAVVVEHAPWLLEALQPGTDLHLHSGHAEAWC